MLRNPIITYLVTGAKLSLAGASHYLRRILGFGCVGLMGLSISIVALGEEGANAKKVRRSVSLEWQEIEGARKYELELTPIKDGDLQLKRMVTFKTKETFWDGYIAPGLYSMRLRSLDWRGVPGEWSEPENVTIRHQKIEYFFPANQEVIKSQHSNREKVKFSWQGFPGALSFQLSVWSVDEEFRKDLETPNTEIEIELPVAKAYQWKVVPIKVQGVESDPNEEVIDFSVLGGPLDSVQIVEPTDPFVQTLEWSSPEFTESFRLLLERKSKKTQKWTKVLEQELRDTRTDFESKWEGGLYRMTVVASHPSRQPSPASQLEFKVRSGDRSPEARARFQLAQAKKRTNNWFVVASYLITEIDYSARNVDRGSYPSAKVLGGTGRIGFGYLDEKKPWGFLSIVDLSGFFFEEKNYTFPALEIQGLYRLSTSYNTETRLSTGIYYKEVPEILGNARTQAFDVAQLSMVGPQLGMEHLHHFDDKWGGQVNGRIYLPLGGKTPGEGLIAATPSFQLGVMGSYRFRKNAWGHAGYAYRRDVVRYASKILPDQFNEAAITGSYLNLYMEWGI